MTQFKALLAAAGLRDPYDAAAYLDASDDLVRFWRDGYGEPPAWAVERLRTRVAELVGPPPPTGSPGSSRPRR